MKAPDTVREPAVEDLRAEVARLVVAITDSWPGEQVFTDRRELAHVVETAVRQVAEVKSERSRHMVEIVGMRVGEDTALPDEGCRLTVGQLWHRLLTAGLDERLRQLNILLNQSQEAGRCFEQDHAGQIEELKRRPTRHAFDEVCRSVELQRKALLNALGQQGIGEDKTFAELAEIAHDHMVRATTETIPKPAENRLSVPADVLEQIAVRLLRIKLYGAHLEERYDEQARNHWRRLDEDERAWWCREASNVLAVAGAYDGQIPDGFYWTARHQLAEALGHKGVTDASVTFDELVAHARDICLTWLSDNGHEVGDDRG